MRRSAIIGVLLAATGTRAKLTVHLVPHTHDDAGYKKTVDQYYTGQNNSIQHGAIHLILDSVVTELAKNPQRTFTYVEQAFFQRWWREQDEATRKLTKDLVDRGQLQFSNGGWCMHDEATPWYLDMVDQTTLGHKFLMEEFGVAPRTGWQIDPFGHSATQAALLSAEVGFAGLFFGRIDYQDLAHRTDSTVKAPEFVWRASPSLGAAAQVFSGLTGSYAGNYGPPAGFSWDVFSTDEPVQDDPKLTDYNVESRVEDFVQAALKQAASTRGDHIMFTMGSDFQYESALSWYTNLDKIIKHANEDGRINAIYSTPERYLDAKVSESASVTWPLKTDDFFPYADGPHQFWTGYFTSRPALKRYVRDSSSFLQVVRQVAALGLGAASLQDAGLEQLAEALGVAQHHDGVSGTARQHVTFDYALKLARGRQMAMPLVGKSLSALSGLADKFEFCILRNQSVCAPTQATAQDVQFLVWNGLGHARSELVELPVSSGNVQVVDTSGKQVEFQIVPSPASLTNYGEPAGGGSQTLLFRADLPAMGFKAYRFSSSPERLPLPASATRPPAPPPPPPHVRRPPAPPQGASIVLENSYVKLEFCENTLCAITNKESNVSIKARQSWLWYQGSTGDSASSQASGAYVLRPINNEGTPLFAGTPTMHLVQGPLADEVHQTFGTWVSQRIRLAKDARHAEILYTVGPIPVQDHGREIVSRFTTDIANSGECYTDSNGREMLKRRRDYRQTWQLNQTEPVAGNYFPVTSSLFIRDDRSQLTVLTETSQGGSGCIRDGELELMVHRACLKNDGHGVLEPLNETKFVEPYVDGYHQGRHYGPGLVIRGKHWLTVEKPGASAKVWRPLQDQLYMPPMPFFATSGARGNIVPWYSALGKALPANIQLVTLQQWDERSVLLRLAHQYGLGEDAELSQPATVDLQELFADRRIASVDERGLAATISRAEVLKRRVAWNIEGEADYLSGQCRQTGCTGKSGHTECGPGCICYQGLYCGASSESEVLKRRVAWNIEGEADYSHGQCRQTGCTGKSGHTECGPGCSCYQGLYCGADIDGKAQLGTSEESAPKDTLKFMLTSLQIRTFLVTFIGKRVAEEYV